MTDDESSRLKQFAWEQLDEQFLIAVIYRAGRRYVVRRHFEQQLLLIKSTTVQNLWRRCLFEVISKTRSPIYVTLSEVQLMHEILSWHLNHANNHIKLRENVDQIIDFEELIDSFQSMSMRNDDTKSFVLQPMTTLDAASKNIEMWKNLQDSIAGTGSSQTVDKQVKRKRSPTPILNTTKISSIANANSSSTTGWIQLDSKIVPFIKKQCDRLVPVEYLLKEHVLSSSEDFSLRPLYIPIDSDDVNVLNRLICQSPSFSLSHCKLTHYSSCITLDHLMFRLKRLFFIRFICSPTNTDYIDYRQVMSHSGGILTIMNSDKRRLPFIYINERRYIPQVDSTCPSLTSTFYIANKYELEYLGLIALYDYLSSGESSGNAVGLLPLHNSMLIPVDCSYPEKSITTILFNDFHYQEYQRRFKQQKSLINLEENRKSDNGWWQSPPTASSSSTKQSAHFNFKLQKPIFF